jgi:hypothetical protein
VASLRQDDNTVERFAKHWAVVCSSSTLNRVFLNWKQFSRCWLSSIEKSSIDNDTAIPLVIVLEFQKTITALPTWKLMKHKIAGYMWVTDDKNKSLARDKLLIIPVVAGTLQSDALKFEPTDYTTFF